ERRLARDRQPLDKGGRDARTVAVGASQHKAFSRQVVLEELAITCRGCGKTVVVQHYPGAFPPSSCSGSCKTEIQRQDTAAGQGGFQERRRAKKSSTGTTEPTLHDL